MKLELNQNQSNYVSNVAPTPFSGILTILGNVCGSDASNTFAHEYITYCHSHVLMDSVDAMNRFWNFKFLSLPHDINTIDARESLCPCTDVAVWIANFVQYVLPFVTTHIYPRT